MAKQKASIDKVKRPRPGKKSDVDFNRHELDIEMNKQPNLMLKYSLDLADARRDLDIVKSRLGVTTAEIADSIRADPESYGLEGKASEASIKNLLLKEMKCIAMESKVRECKHDVDILAGYVVALGDRRKMLEKEVDLWLAGYFAEPRVRREGREALEDQGDERAFGQRRRKRSTGDCQLHKKRTSRKTS